MPRKGLRPSTSGKRADAAKEKHTQRTSNKSSSDRRPTKGRTTTTKQAESAATTPKRRGRPTKTKVGGESANTEIVAQPNVPENVGCDRVEPDGSPKSAIAASASTVPAASKTDPTRSDVKAILDELNRTYGGKRTEPQPCVCAIATEAPDTRVDIPMPPDAELVVESAERGCGCVSPSGCQ